MGNGVKGAALEICVRVFSLLFALKQGFKQYHAAPKKEKDDVLIALKYLPLLGSAGSQVGD